MTTTLEGPSWPKRLVLLGVIALVAAGAVFAVTRALGQPAAAGTPEDLVEQLFAAIENEDPLAVAELLEPGERESLIEPGLAIVDELRRLGVIKAETDLNSIDGLDVTVENLTYSVEPIVDGLAFVSTTGGTMTVSGTPVNPIDFDLFGVDDPMSDEPMEPETDDLAEDPVEFVAVRRDGSWHLSLYYSAAEAIRRDIDGALPVLGGGPAPVGGSTPEAAVTGLIQAMVELDPEGVLTVLDPVEAAALYDYSYLWLPELSGAVDSARSEAARMEAAWGIDEITASSAEVNGRTVVTIDSMAGHAVVQGERMTFSFEEDCFRYDAGDLGADELCADEMEAQADDLLGDLPSAPDALTTGVTVVERDGQWYVSVAPSILYLYRDLLAEMEREDIEQMVETFRSVFQNPFSF